MSELWRLGVAELAAGIERRDFSPLEVTEAFLNRIEAVEEGINSFATVTADAAHEQAALAQREWELGVSRGPLHGVPFAAKDMFDSGGIPTEAGSAQWRGRVPKADSAAVERLRSAGMPLLGKTVTHEFAHGAITPKTRNPWDTSRVPGGSSGGSAAALAAGATPAALGTDTGGSIRTPAALCGVVGIKPTFGRVSRTGVVPLSWSLDHAGPMARTVADAALVLEALSGFDARDPVSVDRPPAEVRPDTAFPVGLRVGIPTNYYERAEPAVLAAIAAAAQVLRHSGAVLVPVELPLAERYEATEFTILCAEASSFHAQRLRDSPELFTDDVRGRLDGGLAILASDYMNALRARTLIQHAWNGLMRDVDLVLTPTVPGTAVPAHDPFYRWEAESEEDAGFEYARSTLPANLTGQPAASIPVGLDERGLPIGAQLIGRPFEESIVLTAALLLERELSPGGWPPI